MQEFAEGLNLKGCKTYLDCAVCKASKSKAFPVSKYSTRQTKRALELVHADLVGPMQASLGGAKYALVIVDDYSRYSFCYLLRDKTEVLQQFKQWVSFVERRYRQQVCQLQTDRGTEFMSTKFQQWLGQLGIRHRRTNPYTAAENGVAERRNGVLQTMKDSLLEDSGMSRSYWGEAILTANYIVNRLWSSSINNTPYAILYGRKPSLAHLRIFGSTAWVHIPKAIRRKGQQKARKLRFVGYEPGSKGYRFSDGSKRIVISRSANFAEQNWDRINANSGYVSLNDGDLFNDNNSSNDGKMIIEDVNVQGGEAEQDMKPERLETQEQLIPRRSERCNKGIPPDRYSASKVKVCNVWYEPRSYKEVLALPKAEQERWKEAMDKEMKSMGDHEVFKSVTLPQGTKAVGCKWVYKKKVLPNNDVQYKARLVAQGFSQLKNLGEIKNYLGVEIQKNEKGGYILSQRRKIEQLLEKYNMKDCNTAPTPMSTDFYNSLSADKGETCDQEIYHSAIGSLLYLSQWSRPDIACAVSILSRFTAAPTKLHWMGVKRVLRYLKGTINLGLQIQITEELKLKCYVDSDYANDINTRKSNSGIIILFGGTLIGWKSRKQTTVAISTAEAEFIALSELCSEVTWYVQLLQDLNINVKESVKVFEDNAACIKMATGDRVKNRSKHVDIKYCNVREAVKGKLISLHHCSSEDNLADMMTKPLGGVHYGECIKSIGLMSLPVMKGGVLEYS